jgi:thioredoxin-related protein
MDKTTFSNPDVIKYMNEHFYAVKLDAEQKTDIRFNGKFYPASATERTHPFAAELLHNQMSYPTSVVMMENFQMPQPIPGYQDVKTMEMILKYFGEGLFKTTPWAVYQANFKPSWVAN